MKISFEGFERAIEMAPATPTVLEIENKTLFTRICQSLISGAGEDAREPYSVWDDQGKSLSPSTALLVVSDPLSLPWDSRALNKKTLDYFGRLANEDEDARREIDELANKLMGLLACLAHRTNGSYQFALEWSVERQLRAFGFAPDRFETLPYLDSLSSFLDFVADMAPDRGLVFVNLKRFLKRSDLEAAYERVFFHRLHALLLESVHEEVASPRERKIRIDQLFLES